MLRVDGSTTETPKPASGHEGCSVCGLDLAFDLPDELEAAARKGDLVIFAGAGISTEASSVFPNTVLELAATRLGWDEPQSFPETLQAFQEAYGRAELVKIVKRKLDYIDWFPDTSFHARRFHRELATMPYLSEIITTNWDLYFEQESAATPFVTGADIALYDVPGRRVLKIHGSLSNLASIVATEADYAKCLDDLKSNVMGGLLRSILATKTVVFVGYSLRDWNFRRLYAALRSDMQEYAPRAYLVSPFEAEEDPEIPLVHLRTSGVQFLRELKQRLTGHCYLPDSIYDVVDEFESAILEADLIAKDVPHKEYPAVINCWFYHDGARDGCFRVRRRRGSGEYSDRHHVENLFRSYDKMSDDAYNEGRYTDCAYIEGYLSVLVLILSEAAPDPDDLDDEDLPAAIETVPLFFVFGQDSEMRSEEHLMEALMHSRKRAPKVRKQAKEITKDLQADMVLRHGPYLKGAPSFE